MTEVEVIDPGLTELDWQEMKSASGYGPEVETLRGYLDIEEEDIRLDGERGEQVEALNSYLPNYEVYNPGEIDSVLLDEIALKYGIKGGLESNVLMLPFGERNIIGREQRLLYFALALDENGNLNRDPKIKEYGGVDQLPKNRIVSFGDCNVACPYCKRDCQFVDDSGHPILSLPVPISAVASLGEGAIGRGETVRFSGGDPVMYPRATLALAEYFFTRHGSKVSIAHNGSGTEWVSRMLPYLNSAAIDLKAPPDKIAEIMGIRPSAGPVMYERSLRTQELLSKGGVLLDVRTPIFGETTLDDMKTLAEAFCSKKKKKKTFWTWRLYKPVEGCTWQAPVMERVSEMHLQVSSEFPDLWMGIRAKWERGGMQYYREGRQIAVSSDTSDVISSEFGSGNKI